MKYTPDKPKDPVEYEEQKAALEAGARRLADLIDAKISLAVFIEQYKDKATISRHYDTDKKTLNVYAMTSTGVVASYSQKIDTPEEARRVLTEITKMLL